MFIFEVKKKEWNKMLFIFMQNLYINLFLFYMFVFLFIGCNRQPSTENNKENEKYFANSDERSIKEKKEHLGIDVTVEHIRHPLYSDFDMDYNFCFKLDKQDYYDLWIEPTSTYYDNYIDGNRMEINDYQPIQNEYPILGCYLVNNTDFPLNIDKLVLDVSESEKDPLPYLYIYTSTSHSLSFSNENWENWGNAILEYKILKKNEVFEGEYNKKIEIPYFEDDYDINFIDDLIEMGYDVTTISKEIGKAVNSIKESGIWIEITDNNFEKWKVLFNPFEIGKYDEVGNVSKEDMYYGFARIFGQLSFANYPFNVKFKGRIILSTSTEYGAPDDIDDHFDVSLKPVGNNYVLRFPYVTSIAPGGNERINLRLKCPRSAIHHFKIKVENSNDIDISSKNIHLHYIKPRHGDI